MPMLISIQKPERVSNILRSSTPTTRVDGDPVLHAGLSSAGRVSTVMAVMPLLLLVGSRR